MKPVSKLFIVEIAAALALMGASALGQTASFQVPTTLPAGSAITVTVVQTAAVTPAATQPAPPVPANGTVSNGASMPGPTNTGPVAGTVLTPSNSIDVTTAGAVIQNLAVSGAISVTAPNVTIKNCTITCNDTGASGGNDAVIYAHAGTDGLIVKNCTLTGGGPGTVQIFSQANNAQFLNLNIYDTPTSPFQLSGSSTVSRCWLHQIGWNAMGIKSNPTKPTFNATATTGDHVDDIFFETGAYLTVTNNNFDTRGNPTNINGTNYAISNVGIFTIPYAAGDVVGPVTVSNNYLDGGGWIFSLCGQGPISIVNNILGSDESYSPPYINTNFIGGPWTWGGNVTPSGMIIPIPTGLKPAGTAPSGGTGN